MTITDKEIKKLVNESFKTRKKTDAFIKKCHKFLEYNDTTNNRKHSIVRQHVQQIINDIDVLC